jgi:hypothetical protein
MRTWFALAVCAVIVGCAGAPAPTPAPPAPNPHAREVVGPDIVFTILEDFDHGPAEAQLGRRVDSWGERVRSSQGTIDVVDAGVGGTGKAARFTFTATFDKPWTIADWKDSGLVLVSTVDLDTPGAAEGVTFRLRPDGFTVVDVRLVQDAGGQERAWVIPLTVNDGEWKRWSIPFAAFSADSPAALPDPGKAVRLEIQVPYQENWDAWSFRTGTSLRASVFVDDPGYWHSAAPAADATSAAASTDSATTTASGGPSTTAVPSTTAAPAAPLQLETFDQQADRMPFTVDLYGTSTWTDYTRSDAGETKLNGAIKAQKVRLTETSGGPEGSFLELKVRLELTPAIAEFHKAGQTITVFLKAPLRAPLAGARDLSFLVRSDITPEGTIEVQDAENDRYYGSTFTVLGSWSRVKIPMDKLLAGDQPLSGAKKLTAEPRLQLSFELPPAAVEKAAATGILDFTIALDSFRLE